MESWAGALSQARREQLEEIDPSWCPSWPVEWQRAFHLVRQHLDEGGTLPLAARETVRQGEDLGRWVRAQRLGFDKLTNVQQWMCEHVLGITPATEEEKPKPRTSQAEKWAMHYAAARQFYEREGHLTVPRKHIETVALGDDSEGEGQERREVTLKLGARVGNQRTRAASLSPERIEQLSAIGMRWVWAAVSATKDHEQDDGCQHADEQRPQAADAVIEEEHAARLPVNSLITSGLRILDLHSEACGPAVTARVVDIPDWFIWVDLGIIIVQLLGLVSVTRRMRDPDPAVRSKGLLDLLETIGCLLLFGGLLLSFAVAEPLVWLTPVGFVLMAATYMVKGVRLLRTRRSAARPQHIQQTADESLPAGP